VLGRIRIRETPKVRRAQELLRERLNHRRIIQKLDPGRPEPADNSES